MTGFSESHKLVTLAPSVEGRRFNSGPQVRILVGRGVLACGFDDLPDHRIQRQALRVIVGILQALAARGVHCFLVGDWHEPPALQAHRLADADGAFAASRADLVRHSLPATTARLRGNGVFGGGNSELGKS